MKLHNICRCCLKTACYKDITCEYYWEGQKEVYNEILDDTFNITMSLQNNNQICEKCITKLRDASNFKKKVLHSEQTILQMALNDNMENDVHSSPKVEIKSDYDDHVIGDFNYDVSEFDDKLSDQFDDVLSENDQVQTETKGDIFVIKMERKYDDDFNIKDKATNSKPTRNTSLSQIEKSILKSMVTRSKAKTENRVLKKKISRTDTKRRTLVKDKSSKIENSKKCIKPKSDTDIKDNSLKMICNSNICLFKSLKTKFRCYLCKEVYRLISELRDHWDVHRNDKDYQKIALRHRGMTFKNADISNLLCKICSDKCTDINDLKNHLTDKHSFKFNNTEHFMIPYKLLDGFTCVICSQNFNSFFRLSVHMNSHFTNNVCEICGRSFINRMSLRMHVHAIHKEKSCTICNATFLNNYARTKHMRKLHNKSSSKRYCLDCNKTFPYTYLLTEHMIECHGAVRPVSNCNICGKKFQSPQNLRIHMRSVHIKERNHPCTVCGMSFFTKCDRVRHEKTHEDVRSFSCSYCEGKFKSKDSLRRHLKRQHWQLYEQK